MTHQTIADEVKEVGISKVSIRYNAAYNNEWTVDDLDDLNKRLLIQWFASYRMGYLDWCADEGITPTLIDP